MTKEEVLNIFYNHRNAHYFANIVEHMMTSESVVMLLITKSDYVKIQKIPTVKTSSWTLRSFVGSNLSVTKTLLKLNPAEVSEASTENTQ